jgi:hypothetical protein
VPSSDEEINLRVNGLGAAQRELNDVATGAARAARLSDQLSRSFDRLEAEANDAQRAIDRVNDEIAQNGPTTELNAELAELQRRLNGISNERFETERLRAGFRNASDAARRLDHDLGGVRNELQRLNAEYARSGDPAVLRRIEEQQRRQAALNATRRRIQAEDEAAQRRLGQLGELQQRRDDEVRRRREQDERNSRGFLGNAARDFNRFARRGLGNLGDRALDYADMNKGSLYGKAAVLGAAIPLGTTALSAVGGATIGAAGAGAVAGGVAGALQGPNAEVIKTEFGSLVGELKGRWVDSTADWWEPLVGAAHTFGDALDEIPIEQIFGDAKDFIEPLSEGLAGLAKGAGKGFAALVHEGEPVVKRLGKEFGELGDDVEEAFTAISYGAQGGADALGDVLDLTGAIIRGFGMMVLGAEKIYETLENAPVTGWFHDMWSEWLESDAPKEVPAFAADLDGVAQSANGVAQGGDNIASAWVDAETAMHKAAETADRLFDAQTGAVDAAVAWEQSIDDLTKSIDENGKTWDIATQKGRDNTSALLDSIEAAKATRDANIANGESVASANAKYEAQIAYLQSVALKAGLTKQQFDAMTAALLNWMSQPSNKTITTKFVDIHYVSQEGRAWGGKDNDPRGKTGQAYASGGTVSDTGFSLVGEQGPEMAFLSKGDYIATAAQTKAMLSGGGGGGVATIRVILQYPDGRVIRDELVTTAANHGQDVASYLGV